MPRFDSVYFPNGAGWDLQLTRCVEPSSFDPERRPLLIIPGYGMNGFIFGYHPSGPSMMAHLAARGFEVWTVDFRNQGAARDRGGERRYHLEDIACVDLPVAIDRLLEESASEADKVDVLGCSLGGTYAFIYLACQEHPRIGALVTMGSPLRWEEVHPLLRVAFGCPPLVGAIPMFGIRPLASVVFPLLVRMPRLLSIYLHTSHVDVSRPKELVRTVEDPNPWLNRELAQWMKQKDLVIRGINVTEAMRDVHLPLLVVLANADGIVPERTAMSCYEQFGASQKDILRVGDDTLAFAHADLFISDHAHTLVFDPIADWLLG